MLCLYFTFYFFSLFQIPYFVSFQGLFYRADCVFNSAHLNYLTRYSVCKFRIVMGCFSFWFVKESQMSFQIRVMLIINNRPLLGKFGGIHKPFGIGHEIVARIGRSKYFSGHINPLVFLILLNLLSYIHSL